MLAYIIRRCAMSFIVIIAVTILVFSMMRLLPGDPILLFLSEDLDITQMTPEVIHEYRVEYGLDKPLPIQYVSWMAGLLRGDFGTSIYYHDNVLKLMLAFYPVTIHIGLLSMLFTFTVGITLGIITGARRGTWIDTGGSLVAYVGISIPNFVVGVILIYGVSLYFNLLPISGYTSPLDDFWLSLKQVILPVLCLSAHGIAATSRQMRSCLLEVIGQDYIRTAWSKGLTERAILFKHALKPSIIPIVTMMGMHFKRIVGGSMIIETIFAIPGVGSLMMTSLWGHDYVVVQSGALITAIIVVLSNLVVDLAYGWLDPRIRYS